MTRRNLLVPLILVALVALASVLVAVTSNTSPVLGLDLQGGFSVVLQAKEVKGRLPSEESVEKAKDIIRQRVDGLGVAEPDITRQGRTVIVQLPGVKNRDKAESLVGCTAKLEFRPVLGVVANPDAPSPSTTTTSKKKGSKSTTTTTSKKKGSKSTTTTAGKATTTTAAKGATTTTGSGKGETGSGVAGIAPGEGAMPVQFAPTTTTTLPPTTTAPPTTSAPAGSTVPSASTTSAPGSTTTTTAADGSTGSSSSCGGAVTPAKKGTTTTTTAPLPAGTASFPSDDGALLYTLGPVGFTGDALSSAKAALGQTGEWQVSVSVHSAQKATANATMNACYQGGATCPGQGASASGGQNSGAVAIVLDGKVLSAPQVNGPDLASSTFEITGNFTQSEAKDLALVLRYGSLPVEFNTVALQQVSATLGKDSLHAGLIAGFIGIAAVALYMLLYYRGLGLVVITGLGVWGGLMYGIVCWLGQTQGLALTLSGITGIIVSVGTTVDSYVVFFERLRDEVRAGRSVRASTERGFASAIRTILTADISSFIGAFLLWYLTVGPVRGFAFFLGLSVVLDLLVAYCFTRPLVILLGRSKRFTDARFLGLAAALDRPPTAAGATS
ncbi:MAG: Protein translocase subunit SecD [Acidimicrobiales bacterium]|nr:Protein translocase subunit SecD [Acidimicrobiales bacterium]